MISHRTDSCLDKPRLCQTMDTPLGTIVVWGTHDAIERIELRRVDGGLDVPVTPATTGDLNIAATASGGGAVSMALDQLHEYFDGRRCEFTVPLRPRGTAFQQRTWKILMQIPYGETRTYQQQAMQLGGAQMARAVGAANRCNPLPIIVPCHRVIGKDGSLTGYALGLDAKRHLLALESPNLFNDSARC